MSFPPGQKLYHITPLDALPDIVKFNHLFSNVIMDQLAIGGTNIGISNLKEKRKTMPVPCHEGTFVGDYVPFYFCPRSVMLYLIYRGNHHELAYKGGQGPILHLEYDLQEVLNWANVQQRPWAFSLSNASAFYTQFRCQVEEMDRINWGAVAALDWQAPEIKEGKQAEFLVHESVPWHLVQRIGVISQPIATGVLSTIAHADHRPTVQIIQGWYY
ncbi:MAG: DUF4433 domain-containing protein [Chloroflexi bacterium]|nr:DUF4433 domain-containing protein [Chloroflexota bacterium]MYD49043.1 DUF4433 domain-containing protein [Chloroflexota bacterium]